MPVLIGQRAHRTNRRIRSVTSGICKSPNLQQGRLLAQADSFRFCPSSAFDALGLSPKRWLDF